MKDKIKNIENLLQQVAVKVNHSKELAMLNGENFNIFSILNLERKEVKTHSAFLSELLNPKGSHGLNEIFLDLFIKQMNEKFEDKIKITSSTSKSQVEEVIGIINKDRTEGGRIDIIIKDNGGNVVIIENKIDAYEQDNQLIRYGNAYPNASIFFLTLTGYDSNTNGDLKLNENYFLISYENDIVNWLENCLKEATNQPILRESIRQYLILVKKLTGQLTNHQMEKEVIKLIQNNFEGAENITNNFEKAKFEICEYIRKEVVENLSQNLSKKYLITERGSKIGDRNSKIWLNPKDYAELDIPFGIEPFSGNGNFGGKLFIGVIDLNKKNEGLFTNKYPQLKNKGWWYGMYYFNSFEGFEIDFSDMAFLQMLANNPEKKKELIHDLSNQIENYINLNEVTLNQICEEVEKEEPVKRLNLPC